jgi:succinate dehydrogenase / fumarate reductase, iron-sulfur subunit
MSMHSSPTAAPALTGRTFDVRILRQEGPGQKPYWEWHRVGWEPNMNCISVLQKIAGQATTLDGRKVAPVNWECNCLEEVCGACTMLVNGWVRQACTALVDQLLADHPGHIELRPMTKYPVLRDLVVDRSRIFEVLKKIQAWLPVDSYLHMGSGQRQSQETQELAYRYSQCMCCGCCMEACPQYLKIEIPCRPNETPEEFDARKRAAFHRAFIGAFAIAQVDLFNLNPVGRMTATKRMDALIAEGGIQNCANAQNCVKVCPKQIPLTTAIGRMGRAATWHILRRWFDRL